MKPSNTLQSRTAKLLGHAACIALLTGFASFSANAQEQKTQLDIPAQPLASALKTFSVESDSQVLFAEEAVAGRSSRPLKGIYSPREALALLLKGTNLRVEQSPDHVFLIKTAEQHSETSAPSDMRLAQTQVPHAASAGIESVVVTSSKIKGDIQTVPIAITALSQEQLTSRQIAGGPDLVKEVPNLTFSKTNFTGYNIEIRGIGTQAISVTTDPAVAVAFNDIPFIRNHFFEQEFYDVGQVEVLRGPQGTLYGRNATAGVVNVISAKPTDQFEAMLSGEFGNYRQRRFEGMINIPVVDDRLDIRVAGEWTKRNGYSFNELTNQPIDGRDLWSGRVTVGLKPSQNVQMYLVWEHFSENDDRLRSSKQLCKTDPIPTEIGGVPINPGTGTAFSAGDYLSQGCQATSLYSADAFEVPNGFSLPYYSPLAQLGTPLNAAIDPYASVTQSHNLRVIESALNPVYKAKNDIVELNTDYTVTPSLTLTAQTAFNQDFLWATEDYNRFNTSPGIFEVSDGWVQDGVLTPDGYFCDPQLGCSNRLVAEDLSREHAWQLSQEFRLASNFSGPLNFSAGGNYLHYETEEDYFVFINTLTLLSTARSDLTSWMPGISDNSFCLKNGYAYSDPSKGGGSPVGNCQYIDPNPISRLDGFGHNYFRSENPYKLNSYAAFGEAYYDVFSDLKLVAGLRWTQDRKHFIDIPSEILADGWGYPSVGVVDQQWNQLTGRFTTNWLPKLDFTDQTLIYGSYSHGYKAGGANPPGAVFIKLNGVPGQIGNPVHPQTFKPEFIDAFEIGSKNTLLDGALTLNGDVFYYNYKSYQISEIVDRTSINLNFDAHVKGAELEATWEPAPGLRLNFGGGYEDTALAKGSKAVDLIDRTAGNPDWIVVKPFVTQASNCIIPVYVYLAGANVTSVCGMTYNSGLDPITRLPYVANPTIVCTSLRDFDSTCRKTGPIPISGYAGFNPGDPAINNGAGFNKDLSGKDLPNAPHFTTSFSAEYTLPVSEDWAATLHSDFYWQSQSFARVFNDRPYDKIRGYSNVNLALILTSASGWQVMGYLKNVFNATAITGDFLNSDDTGLTTNVFLTDPRLFGVRVTKNW